MTLTGHRWSSARGSSAGPGPGAVERFQAAHGLEVDGVVGARETLPALRALAAGTPGPARCVP